MSYRSPHLRSALDGMFSFSQSRDTPHHMGLPSSLPHVRCSGHTSTSTFLRPRGELWRTSLRSLNERLVKLSQKPRHQLNPLRLNKPIRFSYRLCLQLCVHALFKCTSLCWKSYGSQNVCLVNIIMGTVEIVLVSPSRLCCF